MKLKVLAFIAAIFATVAVANAQLPSVRIGLQGGVDINSVNLKGDKSNLDKENRMGFFVGPTVQMKLPLLGLGLEIGAMYSQNKLECGSRDVTLKSIEVPVNERISYDFGNIIGVFAFAGPQFNFNVDRTVVDGFEIKKNRISANFGGGVKLLNHLQLSVMYNLAINRTATLLANPEFGNSDIDLKQNMWKASLTYLF